MSLYDTKSRNGYFFVFLAANSTQNLGNLDATYKGGEVEFNAKATDHLNIYASYGYTDSRIDHMADPTVIGNQAPLVSRTTTNAGLQYHQAIWQGLNGTARVDFQRIGRTWWDPYNVTSRDPVNLVDMRLGVEKDNWSLTAWSKNLTNTKYNTEFSPGGFLGRLCRVATDSNSIINSDREKRYMESKSKLPTRLHHTAYVTRDQEKTRQFYEDVIGLPLVATWSESDDLFGKVRTYVHTFYAIGDGGALAVFQFADPSDQAEFGPGMPPTPFHHIALAVDAETQARIEARIAKAGIKPPDTYVLEHGYCHSGLRDRPEWTDLGVHARSPGRREDRR